MGKVDDQILKLLEETGKPLTLVEIAQQLEKREKTIFGSLRKLFGEGKVNFDPRTRRYTLEKEK